MLTTRTNKNLHRIFFAALSALALSSARADWTLTTADFKEESKLTINEFSIKEGASVNLASGTLRKIETAEIFSFVSDRTPQKNPAAWILTLRNGDVLYGTPAESSGDNLNFTNSDSVDIAIPIKNIANLCRSDGQITKATTTRDVAIQANGDKIEGVFVGVKSGDLLFKVQGKERRVPLSGEKTAVTFAGVTPARTIPPLSARLTFISGSVVSVPDLRLRLNDLNFTDPAGADRRIKLDKILSIDVLGGRAVFLTELDPVTDDQVSLFSAKWPTQINRNVLGQPLKLNKQTFSHGIGVHTTSTLVYELDGSFNQLTLQAGIDDSSIPYGQANLTILLDGKVLWEKKNVKAGAPAEVLNLPIKGGRKLEFRAAQSEKLDVQGRVNWVNVALIK